MVADCDGGSHFPRRGVTGLVDHRRHHASAHAALGDAAITPAHKPTAATAATPGLHPQPVTPLRTPRAAAPERAPNGS
jgi:hypothetical protein